MKNVNAAFEASGGDITDMDIIAKYQDVISEMNPSLAGDERLNELVFTYENNRVKELIYEKHLDDGLSDSEARSRSEKEAQVLLAEALTSYDALKKTRTA